MACLCLVYLWLWGSTLGLLVLSSMGFCQTKWQGCIFTFYTPPLEIYFPIPSPLLRGVYYLLPPPPSERGGGKNCFKVGEYSSILYICIFFLPKEELFKKSDRGVYFLLPFPLREDGDGKSFLVNNRFLFGK